MTFSNFLVSATRRRNWLVVAAAVLIGSAAVPGSADAKPLKTDLAIATHLDDVANASDLFVEVGGFRSHRYGGHRGHRFGKFHGHRFGAFRGHRHSKHRGYRYSRYRGGHYDGGFRSRLRFGGHYY